MQVTNQEADNILSRITTHQKFQQGLENWWRPNHGTAQRICWLFCWGNRNAPWKKTSEPVREAFDKIFGRSSYKWLEKKIEIKHARVFRYIRKT